MRVVPPTEAELAKEQFGEEESVEFIDKRDCYSLNLSEKDTPNILKYQVPLDLEGAMQTHTQTQYLKLKYKRFKYDFFKNSGEQPDKQAISLKFENKKNKNLICFILLVIGNSVQIQYEINEDGIDYEYKRVLESGDAFIVGQNVKKFSYRVVQVYEDTKPVDVILREGALVLRMEKD